MEDGVTHPIWDISHDNMRHNMLSSERVRAADEAGVNTTRKVDAGRAYGQGPTKLSEKR